MNPNQIDIIPYSKAHQAGIDMLMQQIAGEFDEPLAAATPLINGKKLPLPDLYLLATCNAAVVGTIGLSLLTKGNAVLRRMFLHKNYRGQGIAILLMQKAFQWSIEKNVKTIYLGTMAQFKTAQNFYAKNGFVQNELNKLPNDFPINPEDAIFYRKSIAAGL